MSLLGMPCNDNNRGVINTCDEYTGPVKTYHKFGIEQLRFVTQKKCIVVMKLIN